MLFTNLIVRLERKSITKQYVQRLKNSNIPKKPLEPGQNLALISHKFRVSSKQHYDAVQKQTRMRQLDKTMEYIKRKYGFNKSTNQPFQPTKRTARKRRHHSDVMYSDEENDSDEEEEDDDEDLLMSEDSESSDNDTALQEQLINNTVSTNTPITNTNTHNSDAPS